MLLGTLCWVPCDGLASHPGQGVGVVTLLVTSCEIHHSLRRSESGLMKNNFMLTGHERELYHC